MIQTFFVYTLLILFVLACFNQYNKNRYRNLIQKGNASVASFYFYMPLCALSIVMGIRYDVGVDHLAYLNEYIHGYEWGQREILFSVWNNLFAICKLPYPFFFGSITLVQSYLYFSAFRKESQLLYWLALFLFFDSQIGHWNNIIRVSIACCIWIFSINYIAQKKLKIAILSCLLALGFHTSSVILILLLPLLYTGKNYFKSEKFQYILLALAFLFRFAFWNFTNLLGNLIGFYVSYLGQYDSYNDVDSLLHGSTTAAGTNIAFYTLLLINVVIIRYSKDMHLYFNSNKFNIIYNVYFLGVLLFYIFPENFISLTRPFRYFYMFRPIMLAYFTLYLYDNRRKAYNYILYLSVLTLFIGIYYGSMFRSTPQSHSQYQIYAQHPETPLVPVYTPRSILKN